MPVSVSANMMSVVHCASLGTSTAFPDTCNTPSPSGPVPIPYPNVAMSTDTAMGTMKVKCDGNPICHETANFAQSTGDEAGVNMGVKSGVIKGKAEFMLYSFDVKVEGKGCARANDSMLHNMQNTPPATLLQGPAVPA